MTSDTDLDNEMRCAEAVRAALGSDHGTPAQAALRFVLGNRDLRHPGDRHHPDRATRRGARGAGDAGPLPSGAVSQLETLWANEFSARLTPSPSCIIVHDIIVPA